MKQTTPLEEQPLGRDEPWAWADLDPEIRMALASRVDRELAKRSFTGSLVYFVVCVVVFFSTPYYSDHPVSLLIGTTSALLLGAFRIVAAHVVNSHGARAPRYARPLFLASTYGTFIVWGGFCSWTLDIYRGQWTAMLLLLTTAALAGGATSSLAPNLRLAYRCLVFLIGPTVVCAFLLGGALQWGVGGLAALYLSFLLGQAKANSLAFWNASVAAERERMRGSADRRRAEREKASLVAAIEQAAEEIVITNPEGEIQYCNPSFERITGYSRSEVLGQNPRFLKSGKQEARFYRALWETILSGGVWTGRITNKKKDGSFYDTEGTISPIYDASGKLTGFVSARHDVTARLQLESQLRQAQKMESIGRLAGGVAHDFNNLLTVIRGYGEMLLTSLGRDDRRRAYLEHITKAADSAAYLTGQLLAFSRKQVIQPRIVGLNTLIDQLRGMIQRLVGEDVELAIHAAPSLARIVADPDQITHIFMNLAANARDAMPGGGGLTIRTSVVPAGEAPPLSGIAGPAVRVSVVDTGVGMSEEVRQHIFEPFFTTKERGRGTGLGLSTVYGIVQQNRGWIEMETEAGHGAAFHIYFPCAEKDAAAETAQPGASGASRGSETVLIVEDREEILALMAEVLSTHGFRVLSSANGAEALRQVQAHAGPIDLLLTDVIMPGMNGKQVADEVRKLHPRIKVLFATGYSWEVIASRGVLDPGLPCLAKPFTPDQLVAKVREVLGGTG